MSVEDVLAGIVRNGTDSASAAAIVEPGRQPLSYHELAREVRSVARNLADEGLQPGERVLFAVRPSTEAVVLILAILHAGGTIVAADLQMGDEVFAARMALAQPSWVVAESSLLALSAWQPVRTLLRRRGVLLPCLTALPSCRFVRVGWRWPGAPHALNFGDLRARVPVTGDLPGVRLDPSAPAFIVFTSGTTDAPKAVVHTRASLGASVDLLSRHLALERGDVVCSGELHAIVPALLAGARVVLPKRGRFTPDVFVRELAYHQVTHAFGTPADFQQVVDYLASGDRQLPCCVRAVLLGAAPVYQSFLARFREIIPPQTTAWCVYAMSEMLPVACISLEEKLDYAGFGDVVGAPVDGVSARLAEDGELLLRGPHMFWGYLGDRDAASEVQTGDLASFDERGRIVLLGRKKDMIVRRGYNVYPGLVEPLIGTIQGVRGCALVGLYDERSADERIVLAVEIEPGEDASRAQTRLRAELSAGPHALDARARPDAIVVTPIPLIGRSHKVDREALKQRVRHVIPPC